MRVLIVLTLLVSSLSFAGNDKNMLWPRITVWPTGVDLNINNHTAFDYSCNGTIYITHLSGRMSTEFYYNRVYARMFDQRHFFNRFYNDRIVRAHHNIYCHKL